MVRETTETPAVVTISGRAAPASLLLAAPVPASAAPGSGPLPHYRLTETTSGTVAVDSSGHGRDGTVLPVTAAEHAAVRAAYAAGS